MANISSRPFWEVVTETLVPGHTRIVPPRDKFKIVVSSPAETVEPRPTGLPARTSPTPPPMLAVVIAGSTDLVNTGTVMLEAGTSALALSVFSGPGGVSGDRR